MAARAQPTRGVGVQPKTNTSSVLASLGCCQPRTASHAQRDQYEAPKKKESGECSWCIEYTQHVHNHDNDTWRCSVCMGLTNKCSRCNGFARLEGRSKTCVKCNGSWEALADKRRSVFGQPRNPATIRADMTRDTPQRQSASSDGILRPFLLLVSMTPALRLVLAVNLGWCIVTESSFGDSHTEAWDILTRRSKGLRSRCQRPAARYIPFGGSVSWYGMMLHVAQALYVPSYMNWDDEFQTEKLGSTEGSLESLKLASPKVEALEIEFLEKVSKQHRSKMTRVQICTVAQLTTSENVRAMMQLLQAKGVDRQSILLFGIDTNFLMLFNAYKVKRREGDTEGPAEVEPDLLVAEVANFLSTCPDASAAVFEAAHPAQTVSVPPESGMSAGMVPVWLMMEALGHAPGQGVGRILPVFVEMLLQKERLKIIGIPLESCTR